MKSLNNFKGIKFNRYQHQNIDNIIKLKSHHYRPTQKSYDRQQSVYHFIRPKSSSRLLDDKIQRIASSKKLIKNTKKIYQKLSGQLNQIQESISKLQTRRRKKEVKRSPKVVTQVIEENPRHRVYRDVLSHIESIKRNNPKSDYDERRQIEKQQKKVSQEERNSSSLNQQKTLFYGVSFIDHIMFKIKIKLNKNQYSLFGKNQHTKIMLEMTYNQYMKMHLGILKGNPCNIFNYLTIQNNKVKLRLKEDKRRASSFKSYLGYY